VARHTHAFVQTDENDNDRHSLSSANSDEAIATASLSSQGHASTAADSDGQYTCDRCDKVFGKLSSLARHKYEHSGEWHTCASQAHVCVCRAATVRV
jgi:hypothetical protein